MDPSNGNNNSNNGNNMNAMMMQMMRELVQGRDLAKHLQSSISSFSVSELVMIQRIIDSFERSVEILNSDTFYNHYCSQMSTTSAGTHPGTMESPHSGGMINGSPNSQDSISDPDFTSSDSSKRKWMGPVEKRRMAGSAESGLQCPVDDGFSWRKYGQKDILNSPFPRAYYRCTYRQLQGCLATKQVQRNEDDPTLFDVVYRGKHSCSQAPSSSSSLPIPTDTNIKPEPIEIQTNHHFHQQSRGGVIWSFESEPNDIKPIIANNKLNPLNSSSFSFQQHPSSDHQVPTSMHYNNSNDHITSSNHGNFETNFSSNDHQHPVNFQSDAVAAATDDSAAITDPRFSFDQGEFDQHDIMFDSPELF